LHAVGREGLEVGNRALDALLVFEDVVDGSDGLFGFEERALNVFEGRVELFARAHALVHLFADDPGLARDEDQVVDDVVDLGALDAQELVEGTGQAAGGLRKVFDQATVLADDPAESLEQGIETRDQEISARWIDASKSRAGCDGLSYAIAGHRLEILLAQDARRADEELRALGNRIPG